VSESEQLLELDVLAQQLDALRERLTAAAGADVQPLVDEAIEDLRTTVEEFRVVDEELRAQNEELATAQLALEVERARLADLFDEAPDAYVVTDAHGKIVDANRPSARLFGADPAYVESKPITIFVAPADRRSIRTLIARARREPTDPVVARIKRQDGVLIWGEFHASVVDRPDDPELRWLVRDVTDRIQAEHRLWELNAELESRVAERTAALDAERARLEGLLRQMPVGVVIVEAASRRIQAANALAVELLGMTVSTGSTLAAALRTEDGRPVAVKDLPTTRTLQSAEPVFGARYLLDTGASRRAVEISAGPVVGADGAVEAVVMTIEDVTERDRRERADRDFVSNAAHQLRTPLTAIASAVAVLQSGAKDDPVARDRFLGHLERETARLSRLGRALLTLARAQRGEEEPPVAIVPLRPLLEGLVAETLAKEGVVVELECADDVGVIANAPLLEEALANLLGNAVSYTDRGVVRVTARTADRSAHVEITDTGPGIRAGDRERVFERFYRAGGTSESGFGLGLPVARAAIEASGGRLELTSAEDVGTTARVTLSAARIRVIR
jgi:two-component system phosphate regulon sensor histidine kinase PhoR